MAIRLDNEENWADMLQWVSFIFSLFASAFFIREIKVGFCGWEVLYIAIVETIKYIIELGWELDPPATAYHTNGVSVAWLRYCEWLLTCPVILIALSRVGTVGESSYNKQTMTLLTSDQGTIIMGICAAASDTEGFKTVFFLIGLVYGFKTFYTATSVYLDSWRNVPEECKNMVRYMAYSFYTGWLMFPILFVIGPEGAGHISADGSTIGHSVADLFSKNIWGVLEWQLDHKLNLMLIDAIEEEEILEEEMAQEEDMLGKIKTIPCGKMMIVDETNTVDLFFASEFGKLGVDVVCVKSMLEAHTRMHDDQKVAEEEHAENLKEAEEAGDEEEIERLKNMEDEDEQLKQVYNMILVSVKMLDHEVVLNAQTVQNIPVVAFYDQYEASDPALSNADDTLPIPVFGKPYKKHSLLNSFCKYCKKEEPVDSKDVIIKELFEACNASKDVDGMSEDARSTVSMPIGMQQPNMMMQPQMGMSPNMMMGGAPNMMGAQSPNMMMGGAPGMMNNPSGGQNFPFGNFV